jgi:hypothetical protein
MAVGLRFERYRLRQLLTAVFIGRSPSRLCCVMTEVASSVRVPIRFLSPLSQGFHHDHYFHFVHSGAWVIKLVWLISRRSRDRGVRIWQGL